MADEEDTSAKARFTWGDGDLFVIDPDTGERRRIGEIDKEREKRAQDLKCSTSTTS